MTIALIDRFRDRACPSPTQTPVISLGEGSTPCCARPGCRSCLGVEIWLKWEASNPTGSYKDRGMTVAVSKAVEDGAEAVICASTGNTAASAAAYAARAGIPAVVLTPAGAVAGREGRPDADVRRAWCSRCAATSTRRSRPPRSSRRRGTHVLVNSVNPYRREGQKTAVFEIVEELGAAPDAFVIPYGGGGNTSAYAAGIGELGLSTPIYSVEAEHRPTTLASAIRIGDPVHAESVRASGATVVTVSDERDRRRLARSSQRVEGLFCEPSSAAGLAAIRRGAVAGERLVVTITGHGLKDTESADRYAPAARAGRRRSRRDRRRRHGDDRLPRPSDVGQHRRRLRHRRGRVRPLERARGDRRRRRRRRGRGRDASFPPTTPTSPCARTRCSPTRPESTSASRTGFRSSAGSARRRPRSRSASSRLRRTRAPRSCSPSGSRSSRTPTTSPRRSSAGSRSPGTGGSRGSPSGCRSPRSPSSPGSAPRPRAHARRSPQPCPTTRRPRAQAAQRCSAPAPRAATRRSSPPRSSDWLHEPYRPSETLAAIRTTPPAGCGGATLSGSGPTVIAWASDGARLRGRPSGSLPRPRDPRARHRTAGRSVSVVLVDVRPRTDYEAGHLPGAVHLDPETDLSAIGPDPADGGRHPLPGDAQLERVFGRAGIGPRTFVLALDDGSGWAARCWWLLRHLGHDAAGTIDVRGYVGPLSTETVEPAPGHVPGATARGRHDHRRGDPRAPRRSVARCSSTLAAASAGSARRSRSTRSPGGFPAPPTRPSPSRSRPGRRTPQSSSPTAAPA